MRWPAPLSPSLEHLVYIANGGDDLKSNVFLAHFLCNMTKNDRPVEDFVVPDIVVKTFK